MVNARVCFLLAVSLLTGQSANTSTQSQKSKEDSQSLRLKADLLEVRAVVTDKSGRIIDDLKKEDFELLDKDQPQEIGFFSVERTGSKASVGKAPDSEKAVPPGASDPAASETGTRTVVLFVDTLHLSLSSRDLVKQALNRFVDEEMTDRDQVLLVTPTGMLGVLEQFTQNRQILRSAINKITPSPSQEEALFASQTATIQNGEGGRETTSASFEEQIKSSLASFQEEYWKAGVILDRINARRILLSALKTTIKQLADMPGQRLIFLLSDGFSLRGYRGDLYIGNDMQQVINRAVRSGILIYSLHAKGLVPPSLFSASARGAQTGPMTGELMRGLSSEEKDKQDSLNMLAADTGGQLFSNTNDLAGAMQKAIESNRVYYTLAYYPPDSRDDKKFHAIAVRVKGHPEYRVRAQRGYLPIDLKKEEEDIFGDTPQGKLFRAMAAPLLTTTIGVAASADYLETGSDDAQVSLKIHIDGDGMEYSEQDGRHRLEMEVATVVYDHTGKAVDIRSETIKGNLLPERLEIAKRTGFNYTKRLALKPGFYHIRIGVREAESERVGTARAWVEVPKSDKGKLMVSDILLAEPRVEDHPSSGATASKALSAIKGKYGIRFYRAGDPPAYQFMLYNADSKKGAESDLMIQSEILHGKRAIHRSDWQPLASLIIGRDKKGIGVSGQIKPALKPGIYELRITIKNEKAKQTAQKSIVFGVEP